MSRPADAGLREQIGSLLRERSSAGDREIARLVECSPVTVGKVRRSLGLDRDGVSVQRGGQAYRMRSRGIATPAPSSYETNTRAHARNEGFGNNTRARASDPAPATPAMLEARARAVVFCHRALSGNVELLSFLGNALAGVIHVEGWRERLGTDGAIVPAAVSFRAWVEAPAPFGLGHSAGAVLAFVERFAASTNPESLVLVRAALQVHPQPGDRRQRPPQRLDGEPKMPPKAAANAAAPAKKPNAFAKSVRRGSTCSTAF